MRELKKMLPALMIYNGLLFVGITAVGFIAGFGWRLYTGAVVGNLLMVANFLLIGATANRILASRSSNKGRFYGNLSYGARYIGIFAVLALLLNFELISPFTAVIPLFYPKIYYTLDALLHKAEEE